MNEIIPIEPDPSLSTDELDVEGHGLKEVAAGLSTVAILATGAAGLMHATTTTDAPGSGGSAAGSSRSMPVNASQTRDLGQVQGGSSVSDAAATQDLVDGAVGGVVGAAQGIAGGGQALTLEEHGAPYLGGDPVGAVDRTFDRTIAQSRQVRDAVLAKAQSTATATEASALTAVREGQQEVAGQRAGAEAQVDAARTAAKQAGREVAQKVTTVLHAVAQGDLTAPTTLVLSLTKVTASGSVDATNASGTVTVSDNGVVVGTATLKAGQATVELTAPIVGTHGITITYGGDNTHAPSTAAV